MGNIQMYIKCRRGAK